MKYPTDFIDEVLETQRKEELSNSETSRRFRVSCMQLRKWRRERLGSDMQYTSVKRKTNFISKVLKIQVRRGLSDYTMCQCLGVAPSTLNKWRKKLLTPEQRNIPVKYSFIFKHKVLKTQIIENLSDIQASRRFGISHTTLPKWRWELLGPERQKNSLTYSAKYINKVLKDQIKEKISDYELLTALNISHKKLFRKRWELLGPGMHDAPMTYFRDFKNEIFKTQAKGKISNYKLIQKFNISHKKLLRWRWELLDSRLNKNFMIYPDDFKNIVIKTQIERKLSNQKTAKMFNISYCTVTKWQWELLGTEIHNGSVAYSQDFKNKVIETQIEKKLSNQETTKRFNIAYNTLLKWQRNRLGTEKKKKNSKKPLQQTARNLNAAMAGNLVELAERRASGSLAPGYGYSEQYQFDWNSNCLTDAGELRYQILATPVNNPLPLQNFPIDLSCPIPRQVQQTARNLNTAMASNVDELAERGASGGLVPYGGDTKLPQFAWNGNCLTCTGELGSSILAKLLTA